MVETVFVVDLFDSYALGARNGKIQSRLGQSSTFVQDRIDPHDEVLCYFMSETVHCA